MHYLRTEGLSMISALQSISSTLDTCWWYIGGHGFSITREYAARLHVRQWKDEQVHEQWMALLTDYVEHDTEVGRVGKPGFFSHLGDSVDFSWACYFAIEGSEMPLRSLQEVKKLDGQWSESFDYLPLDVLLVARDIDSAYQEYGFREEWMFTTVYKDLHHRNLPAEKILAW
jgi:hypothetical protein